MAKKINVTEDITPIVEKTKAKIRIDSQLLNVRKSPEPGAPVVAVAREGEVYELEAVHDAYGKITDGWVLLEFTESV